MSEVLEFLLGFLVFALVFLVPIQIVLQAILLAPYVKDDQAILYRAGRWIDEARKGNRRFKYVCINTLLIVAYPSATAVLFLLAHFLK